MRKVATEKVGDLHEILDISFDTQGGFKLKGTLPELNQCKDGNLFKFSKFCIHKGKISSVPESINKTHEMFFYWSKVSVEKDNKLCLY